MLVRTCYHHWLLKSSLLVILGNVSSLWVSHQIYSAFYLTSVCSSVASPQTVFYLKSMFKINMNTDTLGLRISTKLIWIWNNTEGLRSSIFGFRANRAHVWIWRISTLGQVWWSLVDIVIGIEDLARGMSREIHNLFWCYLTPLRYRIFRRYVLFQRVSIDFLCLKVILPFVFALGNLLTLFMVHISTM